MERKPVYQQDLWGNAPRETTRALRRHTSPQRKAGKEFDSPETKLIRERLQHDGVASLSTHELLSLVLTTGQTHEPIVPRVSKLLTSYSLHHLVRADFGQLAGEYGLGEAKAAQLQATLEVARRLLLPSGEETSVIRTANDAVDLVRPDMEHLDHEEMRVVLLDTKNGVMANIPMYKGTVASSVLT